MSRAGPGGTPPEPEAVRTVGEWCAVWKKFRLCAFSLERDCRLDVSVARQASPAEAEELRTDAQRLGEQRTRWEGELWGGVARLRRQVLALPQALAPARDAAAGRALVAAAERGLAILREQHAQEQAELAAEERVLRQALEALSSRFDGWAAQASRARPAARPAGAPPVRRASLPAGGARGGGSGAGGVCGRSGEGDSGTFHDRLAELASREAREGGPTGGWPQDDHDTFVGHWRRRPKKFVDAEVLQELQSLLPHRRHEELVAHMDWLRRHEQRKEEQRQLVSQWREWRGHATAAAAAQAPPAAEEARDEAWRRQKLAVRDEAKRAEQKERLEEWRRQKEERLAGEKAQQRRDAAAHRRLQKENWQAKNATREAIEAYRTQKMAQESALSDALRPAAPRVPEQTRRRIAQRSASLADRAARERAARADAEHARPLNPLKEFNPPARNPAYSHVASRVLEDAHEKALQRSNSVASALASAQESSKYTAVPGNWAHQAVLQPSRALPAWRPQYGA